MVKVFTRIEPTTIQQFGQKYKRQAVIKRFQTEDGLEHEFTTISREGSAAAAVIALTPDKKVISVLQFRPGSEQWVYEIPGGSVLSDESPEVGAIRELREETGYIAGSITYLGESHGDAYTNTIWHYYLATNCTPVATGTELDPEEDEQGSEVRLIDIEDLISYAKYTAMTDPRAVLLAFDQLMDIKSQRPVDGESAKSQPNTLSPNKE